MTTGRLSDRSLELSGLASGELERLSGVARRAASAGADQLKRHFGQLERIREKGRAGDLVTEADVAAEQAVQQPLRQLNGRGSPCCSKLRRMYSPSGTSRRIVRCSWRQCTVIGWLRMAAIQR